jgi:short-subunit dehydrogenase
MAKTIVIVGFGPGNATAIAEKFGAEGFAVGLIGRSQERLDGGVAALKARGVTASASPGDAADPVALRTALGKLRGELGPISALSWNASLGGADAGNLFNADSASLHRVFDVAVFGLLGAVNEVRLELKDAGNGAILITNGGFGDPSPEVDAIVTKLNVMGVALANAAKHKLAGLLAENLKNDGIYVGEVTINGAVRTKPSGNGVDPAVVANTFWTLYQSRSELRARVG